MGYAHAFLIQTPVSEQQWVLLVGLITRLLQHLPEEAPGNPEAKPLRISWEDELPLPPEASQARIRFNGSGVCEVYAQPHLVPTEQVVLLPEEGSQDHWEWLKAMMLANGIDPEGVTYVDEEDEDEWLGHETFFLSPDLEPGIWYGFDTLPDGIRQILGSAWRLARPCSQR